MLDAVWLGTEASLPLQATSFQKALSSRAPLIRPQVSLQCGPEATASLWAASRAGVRKSTPLKVFSLLRKKLEEQQNI